MVELKTKDEEIRELRIQLKEQEIRLSHVDSMLMKEKSEKESNAIAFKRILSTLTGNQNKENTPLI
jgi:hypothetical protein